MCGACQCGGVDVRLRTDLGLLFVCSHACIDRLAVIHAQHRPLLPAALLSVPVRGPLCRWCVWLTCVRACRIRTSRRARCHRSRPVPPAAPPLSPPALACPHCRSLSRVHSPAVTVRPLWRSLLMRCGGLYGWWGEAWWALDEVDGAGGVGVDEDGAMLGMDGLDGIGGEVGGLEEGRAADEADRALQGFRDGRSSHDR